MKRTLIPLLALLAAGLEGQDRTELVQVSAVRCWPLKDVTRVVIEVSGEFQYRSERAHDPERIFFDILHARPHIAGHRYYSSQVSDRLVKKVRVAETQPGVTRVVFDLGDGAIYQATQLTNPDRLIVELRPGQVNAPPFEPPPLQAMPAQPVLALPPPVPSVLAANQAYNLASQKPPIAPARPAPIPLPPISIAEAGRAAKLAAEGSNSMTRVLGLKIRRVVLDAGHGGHDEGTSGPTGFTEKELVLDVALRLGKLIESRMGSEVIYTRSDDTFIPLRERTAIANDKKADLFLSIHANSSQYPRVDGVESYFLNFTDSKDAMEVAARENAVSDKSVFELRDLVQQITLQDKAEESKEFAGNIQAALYPFAVRYNPTIKNRGVKKAPFVVLIGASMPSVLAEIGFLSNPKEEALLKKPEHRQKLAEALYRGVSKYAQSLSHFQMAQAKDPVRN